MNRNHVSSTIFTLLLMVLAFSFGAKAEEPFSYTREYFKQFTYSWTEPDGSEHTADLTETAVTERQMTAFLGKIYETDAIPGYKEIKYLGEDDPHKDISDVVYYDYTTNETFPKRFQNYNITNSAPNPVLDQLVCILVKVKDNWSDYPYDWANMNPRPLDRFESMRIIFSRERIENEDNPGWLFNFEEPVNMFFFLTKGGPKRGQAFDKPVAGADPWYKMYEAYSPLTSSDPQAYFDVNDRLARGEAFSIVHVCTGMAGGDNAGEAPHYLSMNGLTETTAYQHNLCFYVPDKRLMYWTSATTPDPEHRASYGRDRVFPDNPSLDTYFGNYHPYHRPYIFDYYIKLDASNMPTDTPVEGNPQARVYMTELTWQTSYKQIAGSDKDEIFVVYRVDLDGKYERVGLDEITIPEGVEGTWKGDDGYIHSTLAEVEIHIAEDQQDTPAGVTYIVRGRPYENDTFHPAYSNEDDVEIPGTADLEQLHIVARPVSAYQPDAPKNVYSHHVYMSKPGESNLEDDMPGSKYSLYRMTSADMLVADAAATLVATLTVGDNRSYEIDYADKNIYEAAKDVPTAGSWDAEADDVSVMFTDIFEASTERNDHIIRYWYRAVKTNEGDHLLRSNKVSVGVYKSSVSAGLETYSNDEILADTDHSLEPSVGKISFDVQAVSAIRRYDVICDNVDGEWVVVAQAGKKGTTMGYTVMSADDDGDLSVKYPDVDFTDEDIEQDLTVKHVTVGIPSRYVQYASKFAVRILVDNPEITGNSTYGTNVVVGPELPSLSIAESEYEFVRTNHPEYCDYAMRHVYEVTYPNSYVGDVDEDALLKMGKYSVWRTLNEGDEILVHHCDAKPIGEVDLPIVDGNHWPAFDGNTHTEHFHMMYLVSPEARAVLPYYAIASYVVRRYAAVPPYADNDADMRYVVLETKAENPASLIVSSVADVESSEDAAPIYYNLQGMRVADPSPGQLYIVNKNGEIKKIVYRYK